MIEANCETDFVAKTDEFQALVKDLSLHIAAANPQYLSREKVPQEVTEKEKDIFASQAKDSGKPEKIIDRIVQGKIEKFYGETCLLEQSFVKDPDQTIQDILARAIAKLGENITIQRFVRYQLGQD
jgi:elongation factor Ts